jgi:hypothetical protein
METQAFVLKIQFQARKLTSGANPRLTDGRKSRRCTHHPGVGNRMVHSSYSWTFAIEHCGEHHGQLVV